MVVDFSGLYCSLFLSLVFRSNNGTVWSNVESTAQCSFVVEKNASRFVLVLDRGFWIHEVRTKRERAFISVARSSVSRLRTLSLLGLAKSALCHLAEFPYSLRR